ncbi:septal ring lytic transglycosylase RlpA family protein [Qipengyuania sp. 6B39]|uniref:septal ring lytic transglycosylase RlpA family protein n=1 Tax=Qipengyuania proteolytica TaxID=2867239 RepID=UPI001C893D2C|nr:septal ring lytic transglycosylase RlpA family protein [Qipengyuania proteolytica]MBX7496455.1 septal ring lytic transglycosylase RlpA family protein [Qipengyuania proteolytica]
MANRAFRSLLFTALVALPATAGHTEERTASALEVASFDRSFVAYESLPPQPEPAAHVVDLDTIEPPVEAQPATTAIEGGNASYYGRKFHGRRTASGEAFDMHAMTAAHRTLPFGTLVQVTNPRNGKTVTVRINDRGPFHGNRVIDVSRAAATELGLIGPGKAHVELAVVG